VEIEREAVSLRWFEPLLIPGLLQTEEYARAVLAAAHPASPEDEVERLVSARMDRQAILDQGEPPLLWVILDEGAATRPVGGPAVMRDQIERLVKAARQPGSCSRSCRPGWARTRAWRASSRSPGLMVLPTSSTSIMRWLGRSSSVPATSPGWRCCTTY
jgi:hypothetical protein